MSTDEVVTLGKVVTIRYKLSLRDGQVVDATDRDQPLQYMHGAGEIVPGLERALEGKAPGDKMTVSVAPEEGFGQHVSDAVQKVAREVFPASAELAPGLVFQGTDEKKNPVMGTVQSVQGDTVTVDFNHPLAGKDLDFDVEVVTVREATPDERKGRFETRA